MPGRMRIELRPNAHAGFDWAVFKLRDGDEEPAADDPYQPHAAARRIQPGEFCRGTIAASRLIFARWIAEKIALALGDGDEEIELAHLDPR